jgi:hypothetical protein
MRAHYRDFCYGHNYFEVGSSLGFSTGRRGLTVHLGNKHCFVD